MPLARAWNSSSSVGIGRRATPHRVIRRRKSGDAARLLNTFNHLARARDTAEVLSALAESVAHLIPAALVLTYVHMDAGGKIVATEVACIWERGQILAEHRHYGVKMPVKPPLPLTEPPAEPLVVEDITENLELAAHAATLGLPTQSFIGLPLYSKRHQTHQGTVELHWYTRFSPRATHIRYLRALVPIATEIIAGDRTVHAHRHALSIQQALLERSEWALREAGRRQRMLQVVLDNLPGGLDIVNMMNSAQTGDAASLGDSLVQMVTPETTLRALRESVERSFILLRLAEHGWNISRTAEALDIERTHLHKKIKLLCIERPGGMNGG